MHELRCLAWRVTSVDVHTAEELGLDPDAPATERIIAVLRAQDARALDLFRSFDTSGDGLISKDEFLVSISSDLI